MRVWLIALFLVAFNIGLSLIQTANIWYSTYPQRYDFTTGTWYTPEDTSGSNYAPDAGITEKLDTTKANQDIGTQLISSVLGAVLGESGATAAVGGLKAFWSVITGIFTSGADLMIKLGFPAYVAIGVQGVVDLVIMYGGIQFFLGRSGKTIE